jgi:hypothetical protein
MGLIHVAFSTSSTNIATRRRGATFGQHFNLNFDLRRHMEIQLSFSQAFFKKSEGNDLKEKIANLL